MQTDPPFPSSLRAGQMDSVTTPVAQVQVLSLAQLARGTTWRLGLLHSLPDHLFIWVTRGQGRCIIQGVQSGVGIHNVLFIPANTLFSLELGKQSFAQGVRIPPSAAVPLPDVPQHLRIRDVMVQGELTGLIEALQREQSGARPFGDEAAKAHAQLLSVWLRRAMINQPAPPRPSAAQRLVIRYCDMVGRDYRSGRPMADYATALGVTPTHLTRSCRQCADLTAADILTQRSLHAARDFLENSQVPINQIADWLGFGSAAYFTRFVQNHTGKTPSALRKTVPAAHPRVETGLAKSVGN